MKTPTLCLFAALALAACGTEKAHDNHAAHEESDTIAATDVTSTDVTVAEITVTEARVRTPIAGRDVTVGFMNVAVPSDDRLIGAASPLARNIEIHTMDMSDGVMRMRKVDGFDIAAGETLNLSSGGNHMMIFGLEISDDATSIPLSLEFENAGKIEVEAELFTGR